jgi:[protein-PII] uridylyltransferase
MTQQEQHPLYQRIQKHAALKQLATPTVTLKQYKDFLRLENEMLLRMHRKGESGLKVSHVRAVAIDVLLENLLNLALHRCEAMFGRKPEQLSLIALGGYGRNELCPFSDIDIMFLYPEKDKSPDSIRLKKAIADTVLYMLWDLSLKVGHSTRTPAQAIEEAEADVKSKNSMLEMRLISGDKNLFERFYKQYRTYIRRNDAEKYIGARLEAQRERHQRYGDTVLLQEPEIKNGVGGLRDYHNIQWITCLKLGIDRVEGLVDNGLLSKIEHRDFTRAYDFLLRVRNELHFSSTRPTDVLALEKQPAIAWALGYRKKNIFQRVELFMRDYYQHAKEILRTSQYLEKKMALSSRSKISFSEVIRSRRREKLKEIDGFLLSSDNIFTAEDPHVFRKDPERIIRIFRHVQQYNAKLDFELERLITRSLPLISAKIIQSQSANKSFRSILQTAGAVYPILSKMHDLGVLTRFIPEWSGMSCLVQHEYYHRYTADEHTLIAIKELDNVFTEDSNPEYSRYRKAIHQTTTPTLLYLMLLLHDIGKINGIKDHAAASVEMTPPILKRFGINTENSEKILFIIGQHLEMARFWQHFDIDDEQTIQLFAKKMGDADQLRYLFVHTFCDALATTRSLWNSYKDALHTQLYHLTLNRLGELPELPPEYTMIPRETISPLVPELSSEEIEAHYNLLPERYFIYSDADEIVIHLRMVNQLLKTIAEADSLGSLIPIVEWHDDLNMSMTVVQIVTWDRAGLFYKLAGAFSVAGLSIVSSKAITRNDHISIDTFYVIDPEGGIVQNAKARKVFEQALKDSLIKNHDLWDEINKKARELSKPSYLKKEENLRAPIPPSVDVYHELSLQRTIIEIQTSDSIGLLYRVAKAIYDHGFDITFARIATERAVAVDTFYIEPVDKTSKSDSTQLLALRSQLNEIIAVDSAVAVAE